MEHIHLLDAVALTQDLPQQGLKRGQVGAVVEQLAPDAFEVEFVGADGEAYALLPLRAEQVMVLHYEPVMASAWQIKPLLVERMLTLHKGKAAARLATEKTVMQTQIEATHKQLDASV